MNPKKIYNYSANIERIQNYQVVQNLDEANILVIGGGQSVSPELFEEELLVENEQLGISGPHEINVKRDLEAIEIFNKAIKKDNIKLIIGINYGALLACGLAGGSVLQGITNHTPGSLKKASFEGKTYLLPSNHLQLMYPYNMDSFDYEVLIHSIETSDDYLGTYASEAKNNKNFKEPEYVIFKNFNKPVLAMMPDVSRMRENTRTVRMTNQLINKYFNE